MEGTDLAGIIPAYALWFSTTGVLTAVARFVVSRDQYVRDRGEREFQLRLDELNMYLWGAANLATTMTLPRGTIYNTVKRDNYPELEKAVALVRNSLRASHLTSNLTIAGTVAILIHLISGAVVTALGIVSVIGMQADDTSVLYSWAITTGAVLTILLTKAVILFLASR